MNNILKKHLAAILFVPVVAMGLAVFSGVAAPSALAVTDVACDTTFDASTFKNNSTAPSASTGAECSQGKGQNSELFGDGGIFKIVTNVMLFIIGAISVIMLIIGGIRYVVSAGDSNAVTGAKNTIMYAVIGIIVALLAYALVNFVLTSFSSDTP